MNINENPVQSFTYNKLSTKSFDQNIRTNVTVNPLGFYYWLHRIEMQVKYN